MRASSQEDATPTAAAAPTCRRHCSSDAAAAVASSAPAAMLAHRSASAVGGVDSAQRSSGQQARAPTPTEGRPAHLPSPADDGALSASPPPSAGGGRWSVGPPAVGASPRPPRLTPTIQQVKVQNAQKRVIDDQTEKTLQTIEQSLAHVRAGSSQIVSQERALHLRIARQQAEWTRVQEQNEEINRSLQSEVANLEQWSDDVLQREEEETNEFHRLHAAAAGLAPTDNHPAEVRRLRRELQQLHREVQVGIQSQPRFSELGRLAALWTARDQAEIALAHSITAANFTERDLLPTTIDASAITQAELDARLEKTYRVGLLGIQLQAAQAASQAKRMEKSHGERVADLHRLTVDVSDWQQRALQAQTATSQTPADGATPEETYLSADGLGQIKSLERFHDGFGCRHDACMLAAHALAEAEAREMVDKSLSQLGIVDRSEQEQDEDEQDPMAEDQGR